MTEPSDARWLATARDYYDTLSGKTPDDGLPTTLSEVVVAIHDVTGHTYSEADLSYMLWNVKDDPELAGFDVPYFEPGSSKDRVYFVIELGEFMPDWQQVALWKGSLSNMKNVNTRLQRGRTVMNDVTILATGADRELLKVSVAALGAVIPLVQAVIEMVPSYTEGHRQETLV
jgi:hypothetical protein